MVLAAPAVVRAQAIPASTQVPIFLKMLTYDRTLWDTPEPSLRIGVLHRSGHDRSDANMTAITDALSRSADKTVNNVHFDFTTLSWGDPAEMVRKITAADIDVLYVTDGHRDVLPDVMAAVREAGILTITGTPGLVAAGLAVGLDLDRDRPRLEVNLAALEAEGHQLDSRVLRLSKVVGR